MNSWGSDNLESSYLKHLMDDHLDISGMSNDNKCRTIGGDPGGKGDQLESINVIGKS